MTRIKILLSGIATAAVMSLPATAATFTGTAGFESSNDLTVIEEGDRQFEFLDLTSTMGLSSEEAVSTYSGGGFSLASLSQVNLLLGSFGFNEFATPEPGEFLRFSYEPADADIAGLQAAIGQTSSNTQSLGRFSFDNLVGELCISSVENCSLGTAWVLGNERQPFSSVGNFLVREISVAPVPLPAGGLLLVAGLGALGALRRRAKA